MAFTELSFFVFAACLVLFYYLLPAKMQWIVLLTGSVIFYVSYGAEKLPFLLAAAGIAWWAALRMEKIRPDGPESRALARKKQKKVLLGAGALLVLLLLYAKVGTWVIQSFAALLRLNADSVPQAILALGVSYYTFSMLGYLADVYYGKEKAETNFLRFLLFAIYFPKILQGPISRHKFLAPQLKETHRFCYEAFCFGFQLMLWGYFKKMVIADRLAMLVNYVFDNVETQTGAHLLMAACFSAVQLYCDFSGCMDIAGGFSQILGLKLEPNFNHPFFSRSAAEFWRRWHITLGTWFKDYVYMPLAISPRVIRISKKVRETCGARAGKAVMTVLPLSVVWVLTGLWHSTGWNYVVWGVYWGTLIICANVFAPELKKLTGFLHINTKTESWKIFQMVRTFFLFVVGRILTVPGTLHGSAEVFKKIFFDFQPGSLFDGSVYSLELDRANFHLALVCIFVLWAVSMLQEKKPVRQRLAESNVVFRWAAWYALLFSIVIFGVYGPEFSAAAFVYMNF